MQGEQETGCSAGMWHTAAFVHSTPPAVACSCPCPPASRCKQASGRSGRAHRIRLAMVLWVWATIVSSGMSLKSAAGRGQEGATHQVMFGQGNCNLCRRSPWCSTFKVWLQHDWRSQPKLQCRIRAACLLCSSWLNTHLSPCTTAAAAAGTAHHTGPLESSPAPNGCSTSTAASSTPTTP